MEAELDEARSQRRLRREAVAEDSSAAAAQEDGPQRTLRSTASASSVPTPPPLPPQNQVHVELLVSMEVDCGRNQIKHNHLMMQCSEAKIAILTAQVTSIIKSAGGVIYYVQGRLGILKDDDRRLTLIHTAYGPKGPMQFYKQST